MKNKNLHVRLPEDLLDEFARVTDAGAVNRSELVRQWIENYIEEATKMEKYRGIVKDDMGSMESKQTKWYDTYKEAHDAAEKLCKRTMGDRGSISVEDGEGKSK